MAENTRYYRLPSQLSPDALKARLAKTHRLLVEAESSLLRNSYDSFDWRLYNSGMLLEEVVRGRSRTLQCRRLDQAVALTLQGVRKVPAFTRDFPEGALRDRLEPVLEMRALLLQMRVKVRQQIIRVLDDNDKTVLRLLLEDATVESPDRQQGAELGYRVEVLPVKGYMKPLKAMHVLLGAEIGLKPVGRDPLVSAMEAVGVAPGAYSSKINVALDPDMPAEAALKRILLDLLKTLEANVEGTCKDVDSEFLHDLRVATRRTRSALTQVKGVLPVPELEYFKQEFAWVGQITGPTRDMDVYLLKLPAYRESLPGALQPDLDPLQDFLVAHHKKEQRRLARQLASEHFRKLLIDWRRFLESPADSTAAGPSAALAVRDVAGKRIFKIYRRVLREGLAITEESPADALHELRKSCKKLRYLMEFFSNIFDNKKVGQLIKQLKILLDNLGDFQDLEVQAKHLRDFAGQMMKEGKVPAQTFLAMGVLVDGLYQRQREERAVFADRFSAFAGKGNRALFQALFKPAVIAS